MRISMEMRLRLEELSAASGMSVDQLADIAVRLSIKELEFRYSDPLVQHADYQSPGGDDGFVLAGFGQM